MSPAAAAARVDADGSHQGSTVLRVGFGCAGLMRSASAKHRQRLLAVAFDQGIRYFDVARMYGLGAAERELGRFAGARRDEIVIATKFGIAAATAGRLARLQSPARAAIARLPAVRAAVKRRAHVFHQPRCYDTATLSASLETSLKEIGTDYVDVLFIHGPAPDDILDLAELSGALDELRRIGRVRAWGFAGDLESLHRLEHASQLPDNPSDSRRHPR